MNQPVLVEREEINYGRFRGTVTKSFYYGPEEREEQVKALKILKAAVPKEVTPCQEEQR